jgi:hypothetical protein
MAGIKIFELLEELVPGGCARARMLNWNGREYVPSTFASLKVHDFVGEHGIVGDRGYCYMSEDSNRWEVLGTMVDSRVHSVTTDDEHDGKQGIRRRPLFPALGQSSHDDWPSSSLM